VAAGAGADGVLPGGAGDRAAVAGGGVAAAGGGAARASVRASSIRGAGWCASGAARSPCCSCTWCCSVRSPGRSGRGRPSTATPRWRSSSAWVVRVRAAVPGLGAQRLSLRGRVAAAAPRRVAPDVAAAQQRKRAPLVRQRHAWPTSSILRGAEACGTTEADIEKLAAPLAVVPPAVEVAPSVEALRFLDRLFPGVVYPAALLVVVMAARPLAAGLVGAGLRGGERGGVATVAAMADAARVAELLRYAGFVGGVADAAGLRGRGLTELAAGPGGGLHGADLVAWAAGKALAGRAAWWRRRRRAGCGWRRRGVVPVVSAVAAILVCGVLMTAIVGHLDSGGGGAAQHAGPARARDERA
jgi:hypothetical protein